MVHIVTYRDRGTMKARTTVPKRELINLIGSKIPASTIFEILNLGSDTNIDNKLNSLLKKELIEIITKSDNGIEYLEELEHEYPLGYSPTLYMVIIQPLPSYEEIIQLTRELMADGNKNEYFLGEDKSIRKVYISAPANFIDHTPPILEIKFFLIYDVVLFGFQKNINMD